MTPDLKPGLWMSEANATTLRELAVLGDATHHFAVSNKPWPSASVGLYTQDQLDAAVRAERKACANIARLRGSEANWLWNDNVEPDKNMARRDEAYAIEAAIRARGE